MPVSTYGAGERKGRAYQTAGRRAVWRGLSSIIGRFLNVSHVAAYNWIRGFGKKLEKLRSDDAIEVVEMDEMHTYIGSKKTPAGYGLLLIGLGEGSSSARLAQGTRPREASSGKK